MAIVGSTIAEWRKEGSRTLGLGAWHRERGRTVPQSPVLHPKQPFTEMWCRQIKKKTSDSSLLWLFRHSVSTGWLESVTPWTHQTVLLWATICWMLENMSTSTGMVRTSRWCWSSMLFLQGRSLEFSVPLCEKRWKVAYIWLSVDSSLLVQGFTSMK